MPKRISLHKRKMPLGMSFAPKKGKPSTLDEAAAILPAPAPVAPAPAAAAEAPMANLEECNNNDNESTSPPPAKKSRKQAAPKQKLPTPQDDETTSPVQVATTGGHRFSTAHLDQDGFLVSLFNKVKGNDEAIIEAEAETEKSKPGLDFRAEVTATIEELKLVQKKPSLREPLFRFEGSVMDLEAIVGGAFDSLLAEQGLALDKGTGEELQMEAINKYCLDNCYESSSDSSESTNENEFEIESEEEDDDLEYDEEEKEFVAKPSSALPSESVDTSSPTPTAAPAKDTAPKTATTNNLPTREQSPTTVLDAPTVATTTPSQAAAPVAAAKTVTAATANNHRPSEKPLSKKKTIENLRRQAEEFHENLSSNDVADALFPDGCITMDITKDRKTAWKSCIERIISEFTLYGLEVDYMRSPHFFPDNYQLTQKELELKKVKVEQLKEEDRKKAKDATTKRMWPQISFAHDRKFFLHCQKCRNQAKKLSVVAVGRFLLNQEDGAYECQAKVEHVYYHDSNCCGSGNKAKLQVEHHAIFEYNHNTLFKGLFDQTARDLDQFTADNPGKIPDGSPIATSDTIRYDDRMFVDLPFKKEVPSESFWRKSIDTNSVYFKRFVIRLGFCMASKLDLSRDIAPFVIDFHLLRKPDPENPCGARQVQDKPNIHWHLFVWNQALLLGGRELMRTKYGDNLIHQYCHTDAPLGPEELEDPTHPLSQLNAMKARALPASFMFALEDERKIYINHPDHKVATAEKRNGSISSSAIYFDNLCWHGGMTEAEADVGAGGPDRKWRLALHGHLDSIHYVRKPEALSIPTLGVDGGLYILPEHTAIRNTLQTTKNELIHYCKALSTVVSLLKGGGREQVLASIPAKIRAVLEKEFSRKKKDGGDDN